MTPRRISEFPDFVGKELLLLAQKRGLAITGGALGSDAAPIMLIGLASILAEHDVGGINEIAQLTASAPADKKG